jgi:hypothetical protein
MDNKDPMQMLGGITSATQMGDIGGSDTPAGMPSQAELDKYGLTAADVEKYGGASWPALNTQSGGGGDPLRDAVKTRAEGGGDELGWMVGKYWGAA